MILKIDTDKMTVEKITEEDSTSSNLTLADCFREHRGETEFTGMVAEIQKWYYGFVSKTAWCASSVSFFANEIGILDQIGGKNDNVYNMMKACEKSGKGTFYSKDNIPKALKKGDILFWLWKGDTMTASSFKHVGVCEYDTSANLIYCIGGNQKDKICTLQYDRTFLYAVFRPEY